MKNPCKNCVVFAACSKDCEEYYNYSEWLEKIVSIFGVIFGGILAVLYIGAVFYINAETSYVINIYFIWIVTSFANILITTFFTEFDYEFFMFLLAPWVLFILILSMIFGKIMKKQIRVHKKRGI